MSGLQKNVYGKVRTEILFPDLFPEIQIRLGFRNEAEKTGGKRMNPFHWRGSKSRIVQKILPYFGTAKVYVEAFCGGASLFWNKSPHPVEVLNDLDGDVINFFRMLQDPEKRIQLEEKLSLTLYSRDEFRKALELEILPSVSDVDRAWAFFVRQNQGFAGSAQTEGRWGRSFIGSESKGSSVNRSWNAKKSHIRQWCERLENVQVDNVDALTCISYWDSDDTAFYLDPPYVPDTRVKGFQSSYKHDCDLDFHEKLVKLLTDVKGSVVLSGYPSDVYKPLENSGWNRLDLDTLSFGVARTRETKYKGSGGLETAEENQRTECLWIKPGKSRKFFGVSRKDEKEGES
jgi:DNA adenine methylase